MLSVQVRYEHVVETNYLQQQQTVNKHEESWITI